MAQAVNRRLAVPWVRRLVAGWPCHGSGGKSPVGHAMAQAVSRKPLTTKARIRSQASPCEICAVQSGTVTDFCPSTCVSPVSNFHQRSKPIFIYMLSLPDGQRGKTCEPSKKQCFFHNTDEHVTVLSVTYALRPKTQLTLQTCPMVNRHAQTELLRLGLLRNFFTYKNESFS